MENRRELLNYLLGSGDLNTAKVWFVGIEEALIKSIENQFGFPHNKSKDIVESFLEIIKQSLENCEDVMISEVGKFYVNEKKTRKGRNLQKGEHIIIEPRKVFAFS